MTKQTHSDGWVYYRPLRDGQAPADYCKDAHEVQLARTQYQLGDEPSWSRIFEYRYRSKAGTSRYAHADGSRECRPAGIGHNGGPPLDPLPSLPEDPETRNQFPMADGLLDYFPNALAEVAKLSYVATQQHHPDQPMHWDRSKSTDHANKIIRHLVDRGKLDDKGMRHSAMIAWRALAMLQEELERETGVPVSRASRNAA